MHSLPTHPLYRFREWRAGDGTHLFELNADPRVLQWTGDRPFLDLSEAEEFVRGYAAFRQKGMGRWLLEDAASGSVLGWAGLRKTGNVIDLGFRLHALNWNQGHATRIAHAILDWAKEQKIQQVYAQHHPENLASQAVLRKVQFHACEPYAGCNPAWLKYTRFL